MINFVLCFCLFLLQAQTYQSLSMSRVRTFKNTARLNHIFATKESPSIPKRILSGVQPTGSLHLGNYLGAIKQWVQFQDVYESYFCVVDLHAITIPQDPAKLKSETLSAAALYIALGINPERSKIFVQSHVSAHSELAWILNCITPMSWLERMIQYKEKSTKHENVGVGLFGYPVLMAADILLYQAELVPVGEDQKQHLELARDIARKFNSNYCKSNRPVFKEPDAFISNESARIMSLQDGRAKMSKSSENDNSRINLLDPPDVISKKIKRCKTDAFTGLEWDNPSRPECTNLLNIYQSVTGKTHGEILAEVSTMNWGSFKPLLAETVIEHLKPVQIRYQEIMKDTNYLQSVLNQGSEEASHQACKTLKQVKEAVGLYVA